MRNITTAGLTACSLALTACTPKPENPELKFVNIGFALQLPRGMQPLFAVVADIDGDGTLDAVMEGNSPGDSALRVIAVFNGAKPKAMEISRIPLYDADAVGIYLSRPRGSRPGTFMLVDYPDSSTEYRYAKERFVGTKIASN